MVVLQFSCVNFAMYHKVMKPPVGAPQVHKKIFKFVLGNLASLLRLY